MATKARKMPVKLNVVHLSGEYEGWEFAHRTNPPMGKWLRAIDSLSKIDESSTGERLDIVDSMLDILELVLIHWNFVDENGLGIDISREGFEKLPEELLEQVFAGIMEAVTQPPLVNSSS